MGENECMVEGRIRQLETAQAETGVYVKQIREDIYEIKSSLKELRVPVCAKPVEESKVWQPVILELIKLAGTCITILGAIVGAVKILGK